MTLAVSMQGISKRYGTVQALDDVTFEVEQGTIHALVGENGAGKTTLMRALYGAMQPDAGAITIKGRTADLHSSADAIKAGVGMVSQHYGIIGELSNLENLVLGAEDSPILDKAKMTTRATELASKMGFEFDWSAESSTLSPAGGQKLEILKLLWRSSRIMILDEPTAMLSPQDSDALYTSLKQLAYEGATVIVVTHRIAEVFDHCRRVTVLRGGKKIADHEVADVTPERLAQEIVGGEVIERPEPKASTKNNVRLHIDQLSVKGSKGQIAVKEVSLKVKAGQLVGIAGVDGNGQRELFQALIGVVKPVSGNFTFDGNQWDSEPSQTRIAEGLRIIPEDRHDEGVVEDWSLYENSALGLQRLPEFRRLTRAMREEAVVMAEMFNTKHGKLSDAMGSLSGGNQQRFVAGRALRISPQMILAFQPARGLDLNSTTKVYQEIRRACDQGACAIVVSFDLDELLDFCDRIVVMCHGHLSEPMTHEARDRNAIGRLMVGAA
ncbi:MAG: ATP-binding cassette domain-containing protein [Armatimonadetes bacterium]|nr:ATP-binding cassette domain-containing protein [Armatimonadota bacterium]